jgi:hypothetical protein
MDGLTEEEKDFVEGFKFCEMSFLPKELLEFIGRRKIH